ncbi:MAG TPA: S9 family peptidase [Rhizomicrobium sp.]|nr:S9 family peptidase [Rhizomicrobium sp.]
MIDRRQLLRLSAAVTSVAAAGSPAAWAAVQWPVPPRPKKIPVRDEHYGLVRHDDYAWLKPSNWDEVRKNPAALVPDIHACLDAENGYADAMLAPSDPVQDELFAAMSRIATDDAAPPPVIRGSWAYSSTTPSDANYPVFVREPVSGGPRQILLDVNEQAKGHKYYALTYQPPVISPDGKYFAWGADDVGSEYFRLYVCDLETGKIADTGIDKSFGSFAFSPDSQYLFWVYRDPLSRPTKVFRRSLKDGTDTLVYEEADPAFFMIVSLTASQKNVLIYCFNVDSSETRIIPGDTPTAVPQLVEPRRPGVQYSVQDWNGKFVILTNDDGAFDYKLMLADKTNLARAGWQEWIAHQPGRFIQDVRPFRDHLVRLEWRDANPQIVAMAATGGEANIPFDEAAYSVRLQPDQDYDTATLNFVYETPRHPSAWFAYDMLAGSRKALTVAAPSFDPDKYVVERLFAPAEDGETVPVTVLMRKDTKRDGSAPVFMYAYGSYGSSVEAAFAPAPISLVDRGWIHVLAHVRGGAEKGTRWWRSVLTIGKKKTFTDFIACAEHLIAKNYTRKGRIVAHSFSAGGLLIGASLNMRPDLWGGAIAQVPFIDLLNTMEDSSHPLWFTALPIWGDPRKKDELAYMASYSPYDNIVHQAYPPVLATGSISDDRVAYWEPVKLVAKLRDYSTNHAPKMVKIDMSAGHMGQGGRLAQLQQMAMFYGFAIWAADRKWTGLA